MVKAVRYACFGVLAVVTLGVAACAGQTGRSDLTSAQQLELATLKSQLTDPARTATTKREAAQLLLSRPYPEATDALREFLDDQTNRPAQIAVAEAVAQSGQTHEDFVKPLLAMLTDSEPSVRAPAANALAAYRQTEVLSELIKLMADVKGDRPTRLVVIAAMHRVLDKRAINALVGLLDDPDETIRDAACDTLTRLTNIRAFGHDRSRWKSWWARNKDKQRSDWLADLAEILARANLELEAGNTGLRRRLVDVMNKLYAATPPGQKDALLAEMLKDALSEIRLAGMRLTQQRLTALEPLPEPLRQQVRLRLADETPAVRRVAALLLANIGDPQAAKLLSGRLEVEQAAQVREAIYQALGLLPDPGLWDQLVAGVGEEDGKVAAAAAAALARLAERNAADEKRRAQAAEALTKRYAAAAGSDSAGLREALLGAMGALKDGRLAALITAALKDPAATVRLSAVKGLQRLGMGESAAAVAPLAADADRGVRLAAILAVGTLGGSEHLETILARTDARVEPDAAVRQQAWSVVMGLLTKADTARLAALADQLAKREDAGEYLISVLKLWVEKIPADEVDQWAPVRLRLGEALLARDRPAEAAGELEKVHTALATGGSDTAKQIWLKWIEALLASDAAGAVARMAETKDEGQFAAAAAALLKQLEALKAKKDWDRLVALAGAAQQRLSKRLAPAQQQALEATLEQAREQQRLADRQRVSELLVRLTGPDEPARADAGKELAAMKDRAVKPLVDELRRAVSAEKPNPAAEQAILEVLKVLAPQLKGYDPKADPAEKVKVLDGWGTQLGS